MTWSNAAPVNHHVCQLRGCMLSCNSTCTRAVLVCQSNNCAPCSTRLMNSAHLFLSLTCQVELPRVGGGTGGDDGDDGMDLDEEPSAPSSSSRKARAGQCHWLLPGWCLKGCTMGALGPCALTMGSIAS